MIVRLAFRRDHHQASPPREDVLHIARLRPDVSASCSFRRNYDRITQVVSRVRKGGVESINLILRLMLLRWRLAARQSERAGCQSQSAKVEDPHVLMSLTAMLGVNVTFPPIADGQVRCISPTCPKPS